MDNFEKNEEFRIVIRKILWKITLVLVICELGITVFSKKSSAADATNTRALETPKKLSKLIQAQAKAALQQGKNATLTSIEAETREERKAYQASLNADLKAITKSKKDSEKDAVDAMAKEVSEKISKKKDEKTPASKTAVANAKDDVSKENFVKLEAPSSQSREPEREKKAVTVDLQPASGDSAINFRQNSGSSVSFGQPKTSE